MPEDEIAELLTKKDGKYTQKYHSMQFNCFLNCHITHQASKVLGNISVEVKKKGFEHAYILNNELNNYPSHFSLFYPKKTNMKSISV